MLEFICYLFPSFISMYILNNKYNFFKKNTLINIICHYFIIALINNFLVVSICYFIFKKNHFLFSAIFSMKYCLLASLIATILPFFYHKLFKIDTKKVLSKLKKTTKNTIIKIKDYFIKNKNIILKRYPLIILLTLLFFLIDIFIRSKCYKLTSFVSIWHFPTILFSLSYCLIFAFVIYYLPKKISKILYIVLTVLTFIIYLTNYMLIAIKKNAFSFYDLDNAGEGFKYINFVIKEINIKFILMCIFIIGVSVLLFIYLKRIDTEYKKINLIKIFVTLIICIIIRQIGITKLGKYDPNDWNMITKPVYYYKNLTNSNRSLNVLGLYEYTVRDLGIVLKERIIKKDETEKISKIISEKESKNESNKYSGVFKNKNLIMIMMESIDNYVLTKETMPTLLKLRNTGLDFTNRYSQVSHGGVTLATEFTSLTGLYHTGVKYNTYKNTYNNSIPKVFEKNGYKTAFIHENNGIYYSRNVLIKAIGFQDALFVYDDIKKYNTNDDTQLVLNDQIYNKIINNKQGKFMTFITTIAAHGPYKNNYHCPWSVFYNETDCYNYLSKNTDEFIKVLLERLKEDNLIDDTVIILFTDHYAYAYNYSKEELENNYKKIDDNYSIKNLPFIIYSTNIKHEKIDTLVNDIDMLPTIFNMFGFDYNPNEYVGTDLFSKDHKNLVMFTDRSWYDGSVYSFNKDFDNNCSTCAENNKYVKDIFDLNNMIIKNNYYAQ